MTLQDLIDKLQGKPGKAKNVEFVVYEKDTGIMVCCDLNGGATTDIMKALVKHAPKPQKKKS